MKFKGWDKVNLQIIENEESDYSGLSTNINKNVQAIAPIIISASRSTDIPAFYADWFTERLRKGYLRWINPFNQKSQYISFEKTRVIVFWSKNPKNMIKYLPEIDARKINYYFLYTLNDYENENLEPNIPPLEDRVNTFLELSHRIGKERTIWRFDPLILSNTISIDKLISKIENIGDKIHPFTNKLVISFVDIDPYNKVKNNLKKFGFQDYREFNDKEKYEFAEKILELNKRWNLDIFTCGEEIDLTDYNIRKGSCIDYNLLLNLFSDDNELRKFLNPTSQVQLFNFQQDQQGEFLKDAGQREACGCIYSKDIGQYNTCMHFCNYCYANHSQEIVKKNYERYIKQSELNHYSDTIIP